MGSRFLLSDCKWLGNGCTFFVNIAYETLVLFTNYCDHRGTKWPVCSCP